MRIASVLSGANSLTAFGGSTATSSMSGTLILGGANTYSGGSTIGGTDLASYFNPGVGNNANPGESRSQVQFAGSSRMSGGSITNGPLGTGAVTFVQAPAIEDNGTNVLIANSMTINTISNFNTAFTSSPMGFNSAGNGSITLDGGPSAVIHLATAAATKVGSSLLVNNFTTIKDKITDSVAFNNGNQFFTISGTGTLQLADAGDWSYTQAAANGIQNTTTGSTLLVAGPTIRFGSSSVVSGGAITTGPLGKGPLTINGAASIGSFLQDNGTNITIANAIGMNLGNPVKFDSTGAGSITFDGTGVTGASAVGNSIDIFGTATTLTLTADNTVIINDRIVGNGATAAVADVLNIGTNSTTSGGGNAYPYGTVVLNQPSAASGTTNVGSTFSGGVNFELWHACRRR